MLCCNDLKAPEPSSCCDYTPGRVTGIRITEERQPARYEPKQRPSVVQQAAPLVPVKFLPEKPTQQPNGPSDELRTAANLGVSLDRLKEIKQYTAYLHRKHPQMKPSRLQRKVAEHFKIKLV